MAAGPSSLNLVGLEVSEFMFLLGGLEKIQWTQEEIQLKTDCTGQNAS